MNPQDWSREFNELGAERVRSGLMSGRWDRDQRAAARQWLERTDARAWQEKRGDYPPDSPSLMVRLKGAKWWPYAATAFGILMGISMLWRRLRAF